MSIFLGTSSLSEAAMMNRRWAGVVKFSSVFLRFDLGISFLSAVADRFGLWGVYGQRNVSWGDYARFVDYTAKLNWFMPAAMIPALAIIATAAETLFGVLLVLGWKTRITALLSGVEEGSDGRRFQNACGNRKVGGSNKMVTGTKAILFLPKE